MKNIPCIVSRDLARHLNEVDAWEKKQMGEEAEIRQVRSICSIDELAAFADEDEEKVIDRLVARLAEHRTQQAKDYA